jgi:hypothetical protein
VPTWQFVIVLSHCVSHYNGIPTACVVYVQSFWLQIQRYRFDSRLYQIFWEAVGLERGPLSLVSTIEELLGRKSSGSGLEGREYCHGEASSWPRCTFYSQKLALSLLTSGGRSVGIVRSRTQATKCFAAMVFHTLKSVPYKASFTCKLREWNATVHSLKVCRAGGIIGRREEKDNTWDNTWEFSFTLTCVGHLSTQFCTPVVYGCSEYCHGNEQVLSINALVVQIDKNNLASRVTEVTVTWTPTWHQRLINTSIVV